VTIKSIYIKFLFILLLPFIFSSCNPTRRLKEGERLLNKNKIIAKNIKIDKNDIEICIKQKPNRKIFKLFRFHLWLHNQVNEDRVKQKRIRKDEKHKLRNEKRVAKGKTPKKFEHQIFGEWVLGISEPPTIYDSLLTEKSRKLIKSLLYKKGYFINSVTDSVHFTHRNEAQVFYKLNASAPYTINGIEYKIPDELVKYYVFADTSNTLIKKGNNYDEDVFQQERERITNELNNNGYYQFTKDYIYYQWDSSSGRKINLTIGIKNYATKYSENSDSIIETPHKRFYINNIFIETDFK
jgi:hypothetical protein